MGCASAKHVATVQNEEEAQKGKNYQNGDVFGAAFNSEHVFLNHELVGQLEWLCPMSFIFLLGPGSQGGMPSFCKGQMRKRYIGCLLSLA
ncbi:hypothetical protein MDA_GLEAN10017492 [Myotis davidii]|uniref:Uncharacterized protein n=1 Tax=Myotis davidii TaxID=225400 RepID=L5LAT7_MYODS|nr:hypothetical protein MDA_GLEAN10017492 [Myotis davidii]